MTTLADLYQDAITHSQDKDMTVFMPKLAGMASKCDVIVELGVRNGISTAGLLYGRPKKMFSYDITPFQMEEIYKEATQNEGVDWNFICANDLSIEIPKCDMLFVDTLHNYWQCDSELFLHAEKVNKLIVFHDTNLYTPTAPTNAEAETIGYWVSILKLGMRYHYVNGHLMQKWILLEESKANPWGLTVLMNTRWLLEDCSSGNPFDW